MRPFLLRYAACAVLCGAVTGVWAAQAKPAAPAHPEFWDATLSALHELQLADNDKLPPELRFRRLAGFRYSEETAAKVAKVFGTGQPLKFERLPPAKGKAAYRASLMPLHYAGAGGVAVDWAALDMQALTDSAGRKLDVRTSWPALDVHDGEGSHFTLHNMTMASTQSRGYGRVWYGSAQGKIERMTAASDDGMAMSMENVSLSFDMKEHAKTAELRYSIGVEALKFGQDTVDDLRIVLRASNLDKQVLARMKAANDKGGFSTLPDEQLAEAAKPILKDVMRTLIARGTALEIDDISAGYQGVRASIKGRVWIDGAKDTGGDSLPVLLKKVVARFEVRVPVALVRAVATRIAQKEQSEEHPETADPKAAAQLGQTMTDLVIGKLLGAGYAKLENNMLVSTVEWRDGALRANGKAVELPKPADKDDEEEPRGADHWLQARRVTGSCQLPDYPGDVVRADSPLQFSMRFMVGADGRVRNLSMAKSSELPDYDKALLASAAGCTWIPALKDGKAVEVPMTWQVTREPGSARP